MAAQLHLDQLAPPRLQDTSISLVHRNERRGSMDDTDASRAPLLGSPFRDDGLNESSQAADRYGSSGAKNSAIVGVDHGDDDDDEEDHGNGAQNGVQQADAINLVWSRAALVFAYGFIFVSSFAQALQWQIISNLTPYITSEFSSHSLIPTIGLVASILSGVLKLPISKVIDAWGRPQGLGAMIILTTIGLILMAACETVQTYAAAQVFYQIGLSGFSYVLEIIIADTSSLKNRTLAFAFSSTPNLITTFIGPPLARAFYEKSSWRWAFAASSIFFFFSSLPILLILLWNARKAVRLGLLQETRVGRITSRSIRRFLVDFDALGILFFTVGLTSIFVPLSLGSKISSHSSATLLIIGISSLISFAIHERYTAKSPVIAFSLLFSRNIAGACLLSVVLFVSYYCWDSYYSSYLQVVHGLNITQAGYVDHIYGLGSCLWAVVVGYLIKVTDRYKWLAWAALPVHLLGGLSMIFFRRPDTHVAFLVMCQILITIGGSTLLVCDRMAVMAASSHGELASVLAVLSLASYIGSAGGNALSGAIWNSTLPSALAELLPDFSPEDLAALGSDITKQLSYPMGHPVREAVIIAYDRAQIKMCLTGFGISLLQIVAVAMWKDSSVSQSRQVKGKVI